MKIKVLLRSVLGFPLGIAMGYVITIFISFCLGQGDYSPCVPELVDFMGNEINAVVLQTVLCGVLGIAFGASSVIWEIENWSIVKQTGIYFIITAIVMVLCAYFMFWMEHSVKGFLSYFGIYAAIFIFIWLVQYLILRNAVTKMNSNLNM